MRRILIAAAALLAVAPSTYAQVKISALPDAGALTGAEHLPAVQGGTTTKATAQQLGDYTIGRLAINGLFNPQGSWHFTNGSTDAVPTLKVDGNTPQFEIALASGATDAKRWNWGLSSNTLTLRALNDAGTTPSNIYTVTRAAGVASEWDFAIPMSVTQNATAMPKIRAAMKLPGTQQDAPTVLGAASTYLAVGGGEYAANSYRAIGFGYIGAIGHEYPALVGYHETATTAETRGDLIFATRPTTTNVAPTINFRIRSDGTAVMSGVSSAASPSLAITSTNPQFDLWNTGAAADARRWSNATVTNAIQYRACNDAGTTCQPYLTANRTGAAVSQVIFGNTGNNPTFAWNGTGSWTVGGGAGTTGQVLTSQGASAAPKWETPAATPTVPVIKHARQSFAAGLPPGIGGDVTVTWSPAFSNANYTATCTAQYAGQNGEQLLRVDHVGDITAADMHVTVYNAGSANAPAAMVNCIAIQD